MTKLATAAQERIQRREHNLKTIAVCIVDCVRANPGLTQREITRSILGFTRLDKKQAFRELVEKGTFMRTPGPRNWHYSLVEPSE